MSHTTDLLDAYKAKLNIATDMAAANSLGLTRAGVSGWRTGARHADADAIELMCKGLGEPLRKWLPLIESERARTPAIAKVWLRLAQAAAAVTLTVGVLLPTHAATVETMRAAAQSGSHDFAPVYIMRNWMRRILDGMKRAFDSAHRNGLHACAGNAPA